MLRSARNKYEKGKLLPCDCALPKPQMSCYISLKPFIYTRPLIKKIVKTLQDHQIRRIIKIIKTTTNKISFNGFKELFYSEVIDVEFVTVHILKKNILAYIKPHTHHRGKVNKIQFEKPKRKYSLVWYPKEILCFKTLPWCCVNQTAFSLTVTSGGRCCTCAG